MTGNIRCIVVDDSAFYRSVLVELLRATGKIDVVASASSGRYALSLIEQHQPDLVTLDVEMPGMNGLEVLAHITRHFARVAVVMVSAANRSGAQVTIDALEHGALDFIAKPADRDMKSNEQKLLAELERIVAVVETRRMTHAEPASTVSARTIETPPIELITIGVSTGGPGALPVVLGSLPADFAVPILIVQHMPPMFVQVLVEALGRKIPLVVAEAAHGETMRPGRIYIAPGGRQLGISRTAAKAYRFNVNDDPPENFARPSVDYTFRSLADHFSGHILALIMTGMGRDGVKGLQRLKQRGATVLAQDEPSSVVFGMAMEACKAGVVDQVCPLKDLGRTISTLVAKHEHTV